MLPGRAALLLAIALPALGCSSPSLLAREVSGEKAEWTVTVTGLDTQPNSWSADVPRREYDGDEEVGRKLVWLRCTIENDSPFKRTIPLGFSVLELENESVRPHFIRAPKPFFRSYGIAGLYLTVPQGASLNTVLDCFEVGAGSSKDYLVAFRVESQRSVPKSWRLPCPDARSWDDWLTIKRQTGGEALELELDLPLAGYD